MPKIDTFTEFILKAIGALIVAAVVGGVGWAFGINSTVAGHGKELQGIHQTLQKIERLMEQEVLYHHDRSRAGQ